MRAIGIITGISLMFIVAPINLFSGSAYTLGGAIETIAKTDSEDMALATADDMDTVSSFQTLASTKLGLFGLLLLLLAVVQFIAGFLLIVKERAGSVFLSFLVIVALSGISAEIAGGVYIADVTYFGTTNIIGTAVSVFMLVVGISMFLQTRKLTDKIISKEKIFEQH